MKKILITGGHLTPALAVIERLNHWHIVYVGRKYALEGDQAFSQEYKVIEKKSIPFIPIVTGRLQRRMTSRTVTSLLKIPVGFFQAFRILKKQKPQVILSFGGYVAVPLVICGWILGIPVITHEQTQLPGLANRIIGHFAQYICVSYSQTRKYFKADKVLVSGNPVRSIIYHPLKKLPIEVKHPCIYITGGNLGAHSINLLIEEILPELLTKYTVIHQCGNAEEFGDYRRLLQKKKELPQALENKYLPVEYVDEQAIGWVMKQADVLISRAGANIVSEVLALSKAAIFIPLPWAGFSEQERNAQILVDHDAAVMITQDELTSRKLLDTIVATLNRKSVLQANLKKIQSETKTNAAETILSVVERVTS